MTTFKTALKTTTASFAKDENGNFAIMFAVTIAALIGGLACSIDMTNAHSNRMRMQDTTDQIALLAAKDQLATVAELQDAAQSYFKLNYPNGSGDRIVLNSIERNGDTVTVNATNTVDTYFANIFGKPTLDVGVESVATYAPRNVDIALSLDTTWSMEGAKLASAKSAANGLVDKLEEFENDKLKMSVVPFAQYVNVGLSRRNATWLDVEDDFTKNVCRMKRDIVSKTNCRPATGTWDRDGTPVSYTYEKCDVSYGPEYEVCSDKEVKWNGCVGSRQAPWHERVAYEGRKIPGLMDVKCGAEILPLTSNMSTVKSKINSLKADKKTYLPAGLSWAWRALDGNQPLTEAASNPASKTDKVLVLMTDGKNTLSKNGLKHNGNNKADADKVTRNLCKNIKADGIQIFTIAYDFDDASTKNMLRKCASSNDYFFDAANAQQLDDAFQEIANSLNELRLTN